MKKFILLGCLFASPAFAQQQSPAIERIAAGLGQCVSTSEQRADLIIDLQKQLAEAKAKIEKLEKPADAK